MYYVCWICPPAPLKYDMDHHMQYAAVDHKSNGAQMVYGRFGTSVNTDVLTMDRFTALQSLLFTLSRLD